MSGSSHAKYVFSRCVVSLDAGISISWAADPDGSHDSGQRHHEREEAGFRARLERAAPGIEVLFDELEAAGHVFGPASAATQRRSNGGMPICAVELTCVPPLDQAELSALAQRVGTIVAAANEPVVVPVTLPVPTAVPSRPWWRFW